jgi:hypothetical protein
MEAPFSTSDDIKWCVNMALSKDAAFGSHVHICSFFLNAFKYSWKCKKIPKQNLAPTPLFLRAHIVVSRKIDYVARIKKKKIVLG